MHMSVYVWRRVAMCVFATSPHFGGSPRGLVCRSGDRSHSHLDIGSCLTAAFLPAAGPPVATARFARSASAVRAGAEFAATVPRDEAPRRFAPAHTGWAAAITWLAASQPRRP